MHNKLNRERLLRRRQELQARAERVGLNLRREATPLEGGFSDQAAVRTNDAVLTAIGDAADVELQQIDYALHRLEKGLYQTCEGCGGRISKERLEVIPYATTCDACAVNSLAGK